MKTVFFSILFAICITLIRAGGDPYQATWYGGSEDENKDSELNPSCYDHQLKPDTEYYAAISTKYKRDLCDSYAVVMAVDNKDEQYFGKMVKVKIVDSCHECTESHIDLSRKAFQSVRKVNDGIFPVIWVAAWSNGKLSRDIIYPSSQTEKFAQSLGLSKTQFVSMYKKQALAMIANHETFGTFNKNAVPKTTTTRKTTTRKTTTTTVRKTTTVTKASSSKDDDGVVFNAIAPQKTSSRVATTTVRTTTVRTTTRTVAPSVAPSAVPSAVPSGTKVIPTSPASTPVVSGTPGSKALPNAPVSQAAAAPITSNDPAVPALGDISVITGETTDKSVPKEAPIVGQTKTLDPQKTDYTDEDIKELESQFPDQNNNGSYAIGILSTALTVSGAAGVGILYLKKQSPSKYDELKQKFPEAFDNLKRGVSKSASGLKRSLTKRKDSKGDYRAMPEHMFGTEGLPTLVKRDDKYPEAMISI